MFKKNVKLKAKRPLSAWRKISIGSWRPVGDSQVYSILELNVEQTLKYIEEERAQGRKITFTHVAGMAAAQMIKENPQINTLVRFGNLYPRENIDIFFHAVGDDPNDLSGYVVRKIDQKSMAEIAEELKPKVKAIKTGEDGDFKKIKNSLSLIPAAFMKPVLDFMGLILYGLNIWHPAFGTPQDSFGSMMITNIGSLGLKNGLVPLPPYSRVPLALALGAPYIRPAFNAKDEIIKQATLDACFTFDHRVIDGAHGAKMAHSFKKYFENPYLFNNI